MITAVHEAGHAVMALALGGEVEALWVEVAGEGYIGEVEQARGRCVGTVAAKGLPVTDPGFLVPPYAVVMLAGPCGEALARKARGEPGPGRIRGGDLENVKEMFALRPDLDRKAFERAVFAWLALPEVRDAVLRVAGRVVAGFEGAKERGVSRVTLPGHVVAGLARRLPPPPAEGLVA